MGLGTPGLPLTGSVTHSPLPVALPATVTPLAAGEATLIWNSEQTVAINAPKPLPRPPAPHRAKAPRADDLELIDAEEMPASSSGAPTLDALTIEAGGPKPPRANPPQADFLVDLNPGSAGILGAPSIDVSHFDEPDADAANIDFVEDSVHIQQPLRTVRSGTVPLYDMSAVMPAANEAAKQGGSTAPQMRIKSGQVPATLPAPESKARERKFVRPPQAGGAAQGAQAAAAAPQTRRAGAAVWGFGLVALAAGAAAFVGLRGRAPAEPVAAVEPQRAPQPPPEPVLKAHVAAAAPAPTEAETVTPKAANAAPVAVAATQPVQRSTNLAASSTSTKTIESMKPEPAAAAQTQAVAEAAPEKAPEPAKPAVVVAHNAPPPAADGTEFDRAAARSALAGAAAQASSCRKDGDPSGTATLTITFAPSGRVTSAQIQGPPFAGTPTGGCIANTMRHITVPAFAGEHVTVTKQIVVQ